ncbi:MAG: hypothetical protein JHC98_07795 [Thermoleophilaceae bacterium]|nr:hypothetical protein [Thermoleophilaceae bacterium]
MVILSLTGGSGEGKLFTVQDAVAAVVKTAYDQPATHANSVLYEKRVVTILGKSFLQRSNDYSASWSEQTEIWHRAGDKKGWMRIAFAPPKFTSAADRKAYLRLHGSEPARSREIACRSVLANSGGSRSPASALNLPPNTEIPTDPKQAYRLFKRSVPHGYVGPGGDNEVVWQSIAYAMYGGAPSLKPAQRAAVIGALAEIPGVSTSGRTSDPLGNSAIGFAHTVGGIRTSLYFDAKTSLVTYFGSVLTTPRKITGHIRPAGTTIWSQALVDYRYVDDYPRLSQTTLKQAGILAGLCPEIRHAGRN